MTRKWRRKKGYKLQCKLPQQYTRVVFMTKAIVSSPVNEEKKEIEEEEGEKVEEEDEIRNTMQSSVAMPQSFTHGAKATVSFQ